MCSYEIAAINSRCQPEENKKETVYTCQQKILCKKQHDIDMEHVIFSPHKKKRKKEENKKKRQIFF